MLTVKVQKKEIESDELPPVCMICGKKEAETKVPFQARIIPFPLGVLGILAKYLTPKKYDMSVLTCGKCKDGFIYEQTMTNVWLTLRLLAGLALLYVLVADTDGIPTNLLVPGLIIFITFTLENLYFWTIGRKNAIRVMTIDETSVSLDLPNEEWSSAYTTMRRERETAKNRNRSF